MKLEIGMYCRTNDGYIAKIVELESLDFHDHLSDTIYFDNIIRKEYSDSFNYINPIDRGNIKKASFNLIDLIEVGDYVNGEKVVYVWKFKNGNRLTLESAKSFDNINYAISNEDIKEILTNEQYNANRYEVK